MYPGPGAPYGGGGYPYPGQPGYPPYGAVRPPVPFNPATVYRPPTRPPPARRPGVRPPKNTTLWVGKIASTVEPSLILQLLEACGTIREWKPATDPETGKMKGFGFCTFQEAEGVLMALKTLNGLRLDGQELALKCNKATEEYIEWVKELASESKPPASGAEGQAADAQPNGEDAVAAVAAQPSPLENVAAIENQVMSQIQALVGDRSTTGGAEDASAAANNFLADLQEGKHRERSPVDEHAERRKREREREREADKERQRRRREEQRKADEEERTYKDAVWRYESWEREVRRDRERKRDKERDLQRERARQIRVDNEVADSDDEDLAKRRVYHRSRKAADRRKRREQESREDAEDRAKEMEELRQEEERLAKERVAAEQNIVKKGSVRRKATKTGVLVEEEEEEEKPKRQFIPIRYTEEELKMEAEQQAGEAQPAAQQQQTTPASPLEADAAKLKKQLMALVPKDRAGVFAYPIKWDSLVAGPQDVKERISGWVRKKIKDLMGEDEPSFCDFIMTQVYEKTSADNMLQTLRDVLDEDADGFVLKLYQVLIYECEKLAHSA